MNSFLLITKRENMAGQARDFCKNQKIEDIDIAVVDGTPDKNHKSSDKGIALIRKVINGASLKPIQGGRKAIVLLNSESLSIPAQNALLKTLEEPPNNTLIVLTAENEQSVLPTIRSRCLIIKDHQRIEGKTISEEDVITSLNPLEKAEALAKDKVKALSYLEGQIKQLEKKLQESIDQDPNESSAFKTRSSLSSYLMTYNLIKTTNTNLRLALENLFLANSSQS